MRILSTILGFGLLSIFIAPAQALSIDKLKLNGFADIEYEKSNSDTEGDPNGSFDQYHFNLLTEYPINDTITAKLHVEWEHSPQHSPEIPGGWGDIAVEWSYLEFVLNNAMRIRAGKNLTPFGIYNEIHDATPTYNSIRTPWSIYKTESIGATYDFFPKFSTGIYLLGNHYGPSETSWNYIVYVANGENDTLNPAEEDENKNKALGGRLGVTLIEDLHLSASLYTGDKGVAKQGHTAWVASAEYIPFPLSVRGEYGRSKLDNAAPATGSVTQVGWYAEASYAIKKFTPFFRFGANDPDNSISNDNWKETVVGVDYNVAKGVVFKVEWRSFGGDALKSANNDYDEIGAAMTAAF